jgi:pyruvate/2-oxoglutarate dehydrogenase complex dihydrolipoamide acyltransferase (E2) component
VEAPADGRMVKILITEDSSIPVGEPVCEIEVA